MNIGVSAIRQSVSGGSLPSTRFISTTVTVNESVSDTVASLLTMQFGQFMDHDLTQTIGSTSGKPSRKCTVPHALH